MFKTGQSAEPQGTCSADGSRRLIPCRGTTPGNPAERSLPAHAGCWEDGRMLKRLVGGGSDSLIGNTKAVRPSRVKKELIQLLHRKLGLGTLGKWKTNAVVTNGPTFSSFPPAFTTERHVRWCRIALWPVWVGCQAYGYPLRRGHSSLPFWHEARLQCKQP